MPSVSHQSLCSHIQQLEAMEKAKRVFSVRETSQVSGKIRRKLVNLVGEKPMVVCALEGEECEALSDTGAMVSMVWKGWLDTNHPDLSVMSVMDFLEGDQLHLCTANNSRVAVEGVVIMSVEVGETSVSVPFVVTADELAQPIVGFNVIKHLVKSGGNDSSTLLRMSCLSLSEIKARAVVNLINSEPIEDIAVTVSRTVIPPNSHCNVKCKMRMGRTFKYSVKPLK